MADANTPRITIYSTNHIVNRLIELSYRGLFCSKRFGQGHAQSNDWQNFETGAIYSFADAAAQEGYVKNEGLGWRNSTREEWNQALGLRSS